MWLINTETIELEEFLPERCPPYAILSHRWEDGEVSFKDMKKRARAEIKPGYPKIRNTCRQAKADKLDYAWVDTCCINKESSAELSEAINSMFTWYKKAVVCYVYLSDVHAFPLDEAEFQRSLWFTRGWTLQELLAPVQITFYNSNWQSLGTKMSLVHSIRSVTNIEVDALSGTNLLNFPIATKMSWAAHRTTTRTEDIAYCLLGIFDINMPLLYGEGIKAFRRLQEEIIRASDDWTIFGWHTNEPMRSGLLADSPKYFRKVSLKHALGSQVPRDYSLTNRGISIQVSVQPFAPRLFLVYSGCALGTTKSDLPLLLYCPYSGPAERVHGVVLSILGRASEGSFRRWDQKHGVAKLKQHQMVVHKGDNTITSNPIDPRWLTGRFGFFVKSRHAWSLMFDKIIAVKDCGNIQDANSWYSASPKCANILPCVNDFKPRDTTTFTSRLANGEYGILLMFHSRLKALDKVAFGFDSNGVPFLLATARQWFQKLTNDRVAQNLDALLRKYGTTLESVYLNHLIDEDYQDVRIPGLESWLQNNSHTDRTSSPKPSLYGRSYIMSSEHGIWAFERGNTWEIELAVYDKARSPKSVLAVKLDHDRKSDPPWTLTIGLPD